jgi:NAD(P)-dependent dehydrogenase (short-subunit alcohol dehydrogenase family)
VHVIFFPFLKLKPNLYCLRCLPLLEAKATAEVPSRVINIGSINGINIPSHETYAYSASKAAVHQLTKHLAGKIGHRHILVNAIAPGSFESKMMKETLEKFGEVIVSKVPVGRIGSPEDIAGTAIYLSSRAGAYTNGAIIVVDGGAIVSSKM